MAFRVLNPWTLQPLPQTLMEANEESQLEFGQGTSTIYIYYPIPLLPIERAEFTGLAKLVSTQPKSVPTQCTWLDLTHVPRRHAL